MGRLGAHTLREHWTSRIAEDHRELWFWVAFYCLLPGAAAVPLGVHGGACLDGLSFGADHSTSAGSTCCSQAARSSTTRGVDRVRCQTQARHASRDTAKHSPLHGITGEAALSAPPVVPLTPLPRCKHLSSPTSFQLNRSQRGVAPRLTRISREEAQVAAPRNGP